MPILYKIEKMKCVRYDLDERVEDVAGQKGVVFYGRPRNGSGFVYYTRKDACRDNGYAETPAEAWGLAIASVGQSITQKRRELDALESHHRELLDASADA